MRQPSQPKIIGKFRNAWSHHVQVLCTNKLPLHIWEFSQHEKFDWNLRCRSPIDAKFSTDQFKKACTKNELCYVKQHLWRYEYDYKRNRYSLVTTTVAMKQLQVTSWKDSTFLNFMY